MSDAPLRILLIEDSQDIVRNICDYFDQARFQLDFAYDGLSGLHLASTGHYDVIILDILLPAIDGVSLCKRLRADGDIRTPIIMLTARHTVDDRVTGLAAGADDYLVKPFSLKELEARILALFRRSQYNSSEQHLTIDDLHYDLGTLEVTRSGQKLTLTPVALKLLKALMSRSPHVVTRVELEHAVWGDSPPESDALRAHMHSLRGIIDKPFPKPLIVTVHGIGYRIAVE
ncbi:MAG TPA: DNA-binding response regulator [Spongiibacteraceae bacterium]|nr:DNA-binding response regulator [Spongiibacteraceae bacterium]HCS27446.1 DNA-binding response regulator [Spongiibacteraceae bacterium]|tara:strand:- start:305 stop:994 length:690 start_codon:yes stop_codon:yes gene_type:complete